MPTSSPDGTATVTGYWPLEAGPVLSTGEEVTLEGTTSTVKVSHSGRPERVDDYTGASGAFVERIRAAGVLLRFEPDGTQTFLAGWNPPGVALALPVGAWIPLEGDTALPRMRTGWPERIDDYAGFRDVRVEMIRAAVIASAMTGYM